MFAYHRVALSGSHAYAATSARGRAISICVSTSTAISAWGQPACKLDAVAHPAVELGRRLDAGPLHDDPALHGATRHVEPPRMRIREGLTLAGRAHPDHQLARARDP